jgi:hypothetical protein
LVSANRNNWLSNRLILEAYADQHPVLPASIRAERISASSYRIDHVNYFGDVFRSGILDINGDQGLLQVAEIAPCASVNPRDIPAHIDLINDRQIDVVLNSSQRGDVRFTLAFGDGSLPPIDYCVTSASYVDADRHVTAVALGGGDYSIKWVNSDKTAR